MVRNPQHDMLSHPNHDELSRQQFIYNFKRYLANKIRPGNKIIYNKVIKPKFLKNQGKEPESRNEIDNEMSKNSSYMMYSALSRNAQEMMWDSVADPIFRNKEKLSKKFTKINSNKHKLGSINLNPILKIPNGIKNIDIHLQPGGYVSDYNPSDVLAGAFYEGGGNLYSLGNGVGVSEGKGDVLVRFLKEKHPNFSPSRILDCGCSAGSSSTPWALAFPEAEVHGIDLGAGMLRYAHARAECLGAKVHFHQMSAKELSFDANSFDLVVSSNAMHEMPQKTTESMFKESFRVLRKDGISIHQDVPLRFNELDSYQQFERGWDQKHNNEPYWITYATNNPQEMFINAGFEKKNIWLGKFEQLDKTIKWFISCAIKS